jgi:hypothetical protein
MSNSTNNSAILGKKVIERKMRILIFSTTLPKTFLILGEFSEKLS